MNLPLLKDVFLARHLEFDLAARFSRYDNSGTLGPGEGISNSHDLPTWKVSGFWDPVDWLRVRASQSRDSRAANFRELYYGQIIQAGGFFGYCTPVGAPAGSPPDPQPARVTLTSPESRIRPPSAYIHAARLAPGLRVCGGLLPHQDQGYPAGQRNRVL